ncbi:MAG TPA: asparagine synthase-related protein, partial [bacterium]|nr:asparagine synthase-related protein [bacterium]
RQLGDIFGGKMQRNLRYVDRASMRASREVRLPFLDRDIAEMALRVPDAWKIRDGHCRYFARTVAEPLLGTECAFRPKVPVQDPQRAWVGTCLRDYVSDSLAGGNLFVARYVDMPAVRRRYWQFLTEPDSVGNLTFLMYPLFLEIWQRVLRKTVGPCAAA